MQAPFWKADGETQKSLVDDLDLVLASCSTLGIEFVVIPLVDNGRIESAAQTETLLRVLLDRAASLSKQRVKIVFESDLPPAPLAEFIENSRAKCSASITTAAIAPRSAMIPPRRFRPTRRAFSMSM